MIRKKVYKAPREEECLNMVNAEISGDRVINIIPSIEKTGGFFCDGLYCYTVFYRE